MTRSRRFAAAVRRRLTYANVMATVAVFMAVGGGVAWAASLSRNSVKSRHIENGAVRGIDIAPGKLKKKHIREGAVRSFELADGKVKPRDLREDYQTGLTDERTETGTTPHGSSPVLFELASGGQLALRCQEEPELVYANTSGAPARQFVDLDAAEAEAAAVANAGSNVVVLTDEATHLFSQVIAGQSLATLELSVLNETAEPPAPPTASQCQFAAVLTEAEPPPEGPETG